MWIFQYTDLKTAPKKRRFPSDLAETWLKFGTRSSRERDALLKQTKKCLFMTGSQDFAPGDIQISASL